MLLLGRRAGAVLGSVVLLVLLTTISCGSGRDGFGNGNNNASASSSGGFQPAGDLPDGGQGPTCLAKEAEAVEGVRPVDIIFAIDNSESMSEEIAEVEKQINLNFASLIAASNTDYRVIMLSNHGSHGAANPIQKICVKSPLSGSTCEPIPLVPVETARFFHHNVIINSSDTLCQILLTYNAPDRDGSHPQGWAALLRPNAFKVFAVITDDQVAAGPCSGWPRFDDRVDDPISSGTLAQTFENALLALQPPLFGNSVRRNYVWHSIVGIAPFDANDTSKPHLASSPLVAQKCTPSAVAPGLGYQALSKLTGGLRYPTCGLDYTTIFQAMAKGVIDNAVLPCEYALPANPAGGTIDPETAIIRYTSGATVADFGQVANAGACAPQKFYIENGFLKLCPDACVAVQSDPVAQVKILFGCLPQQAK